MPEDTPEIRTESLIIIFTEYDMKKVYRNVQVHYYRHWDRANWAWGSCDRWTGTIPNIPCKEQVACTSGWPIIVSTRWVGPELNDSFTRSWVSRSSFWENIPPKGAKITKRIRSCFVKPDSYLVEPSIGYHYHIYPHATRITLSDCHLRPCTATLYWTVGCSQWFKKDLRRGHLYLKGLRS